MGFSLFKEPLRETENGSATYVCLLTPPVVGKIIRGERGLRVGQEVRVRLLRTDPYKAFIDFEKVGSGNRSH